MSNLSNVRRAPIKIILSDGKERELVYTLNSFACLEDKYGNVEDAMKAMESGSIKAVRSILWAGLVDQDPDLTEITLGSLIRMEDLPAIVDKLNAAMMMDLPEGATGEATDGTSVSDPN